MQQYDMDPVKFGALCQKVTDLETRIHKMEIKIDALLELANKGQGGIYFSMSLLSGASIVIGYIISIWRH